MALLTIGAFARASRLSPKALRLYDDLGLLPPARVDPVSGYRLYDPGQLEQARLVAHLRRLGMPLARIRVVCALGPAAAAEEIAAYWAQVEADVAARRELAASLVGHLSRGEATMGSTTTGTTPGGLPRIRCAALTDTGLVRESNQDAVHADSRLLAVADGFGSAGAAAGAAVIDVLRGVDVDLGAGGGLPPGELLNTLADAVERANAAVHGLTAEGPDGPDGDSGAREAGTTLTAMLWSGTQPVLVHIGDSRAHLLRDGEFFQITHDHTLVRSMVDEGRITEAEALSHPQRSLLLRALDGRPGRTADLRLHEARPGDRYLLCSDGLGAVVPVERVRQVVAGVADPERAVRELVGLARAAGGPDNVSCVVADVA